MVKVKFKSRNSILFFSAILLALTGFVYGYSLTFDFVEFDDNLYIFNNRDVIFFNGEVAVKFLTNYVYGHYHPITMLSYGIQYALHGDNPFYFHLVNFIVHFFNCVLLFLFLRQLKIPHWLVAFTCLVFCVHPLQVESVAWVGTRGGILSAFFGLTALWSYTKYVHKEQLKWMLLSVLMLLLALASKSGALVIPLVFFAIDYLVKRRLSYTLVLEKLPMLFASLIFGMIAIQAAKDIGSVTEGSTPVPVLERFVLIFYSLGFYVVKFFAPFHLSNMHFDAYMLYDDIPNAYYYIIAGGAVLVGVLIFMSKHKRVLFFGFATYFLLIILVANILPVGGTIVSERYAYLPIIGIGIAAGSGIQDIFRKMNISKRTAQVLALAFVLFLASLALKRTEVWKNSKSLFTDLVEKYPGYSYGYYGLGNHYLGLGETDTALALYTEAIEISPQKEYFLNRGVAHFRLNEHEKALRDLNVHAAVSPESPGTYANRGLVNYNLGNLKGALRDFDLAILLDSINPKAYFNRGHLKIELGDMNGGCEDLEKAMQLGFAKAKESYKKYCGVSEVVSQKGRVTQEKGEKLYYDNGQLKFETVKKPDQEGDTVNWIVYYDKSGNVQEEGVIKNGKYAGKVKWYYPSGQLKIEGYYKDILPYGEWREYYESGELFAEYKYENGKKHGTLKYYYEGGALWTEREYKNGLLWNVIRLKDPSGKPLDKDSFKDGSGKLKIYDKKGNFQKLLTYDNGKLIK